MRQVGTDARAPAPEHDGADRATRRMRLRVRLVAALVALSTGGLAVFGVVTYSLYSRSQYQRLDDQLRAAVPALARELQAQADGSTPHPAPRPARRPGRPRPAGGGGPQHLRRAAPTPTGR